MRPFQPFINFLHLPSLFFLIGYPLFWLEVYFSPRRDGITSPLAWILFLVMAVWIMGRQRQKIASGFAEGVRTIRSSGKWTAVLVILGGAAAVGTMVCAAYAAAYPPHLQQETDVLNYHYTLPRQHLIQHSFAHLRWSSADLFLLPVQWALAPFWFATSLLNKIPQLFFALGLAGVGTSLVRRRGGSWLSASVVPLAVLGSHSIGIQMGTGMLDLAIAYLFFAALDSFDRRQWAVGLVELNFFLWSKAFVPVQMGMILLGLGACVIIGRKLGWTAAMPLSSWSDVQAGWKKWLAGFLVVSLCVGGPFLFKSLYYSGTPLFPFGVGVWVPPAADSSSEHWRSLSATAGALTDVRDAYGHGRSGLDFLKHFWLVAVPEKGVNNAFDYPLGLMYLLFLGPFAYFFAQALKRKTLDVPSLFIVLFWLTWWAGSQQGRFLFIAMIGMYLTVLGRWKPSVIGLAAMVFAVALTALSVARAHRLDFGRSAEEVLRPKDLQLVEESRRYLEEQKMGVVFTEDQEAAFAQFPIIVTKEKRPFVLAL